MEQIGHQVDAENPVASSRGAPAQFPAALSFRVLPNLVCQFFNLFRFLQQIQRRQVRRVCLVHFRLQFPGELIRSEEHTSELQSRLHLVCRLLLEKKNYNTEHYMYGSDLWPL